MTQAQIYETIGGKRRLLGRLPKYKKRKYEGEQVYQARMVRANDRRLARLARLVRVPELKAHYQNKDNFAPGVGGTTFVLTNLAQGADSNNRLGTKVNGCYISFSAQVFSDTNPTTLNTRFIFYKDKDCAGALPTIAQVLFGAGGPLILDYPQMDYRPKFRILRDALIPKNTFNPVTLTSAASQADTQIVRFRIPCRYNITYDASNAGDVTDCLLNHIFALVICEDADTHVECTWQFIFRDG